MLCLRPASRTQALAFWGRNSRCTGAILRRKTGGSTVRPWTENQTRTVNLLFDIFAGVFWHSDWARAAHLSGVEISPSFQKPSAWTLSIAAPLPLPDILLTHNCGSPPPIAGINPHLRPPRHTVCSPTMHLSSESFPDTFGLFSIAYSSLPLRPPSFQPASPRLFIGQFHLLRAFSFWNSLNFPPFFPSIHPKPI